MLSAKYKLYEAIRQYIKTWGLAPTQDELAALVGRVKSTINKHLRFLAKLGLIRLIPRKWRGIELVNNGLKPTV